MHTLRPASVAKVCSVVYRMYKKSSSIVDGLGMLIIN